MKKKVVVHSPWGGGWGENLFDEFRYKFSIGQNVVPFDSETFFKFRLDHSIREKFKRGNTDFRDTLYDIFLIDFINI